MESQNQMSIQPRTCQIHVAMIGTLSLLHLKLDHSAHGEMEKLRQDDPVPIACGRPFTFLELCRSHGESNQAVYIGHGSIENSDMETIILHHSTHLEDLC